MTSSRRTKWIIPAGLISLCVIPLLAGVTRLAALGNGGPITLESLKYFAAPLPVALHIVSSLIFCIAGAFQFLPGARHHESSWHRIAGRRLVPCGIVAALSGLWMTQFFPPGEFDGPCLYGIRLVVGAAMALFLCLGIRAVRQGDIPGHGAWMMRGYALGLGAGTQVLTHLPWFLFPNMQGEMARTLSMAAGWIINLAVAEWRISARRHEKSA